MNSITEEPIGPINEIVARVWEILAGNVPADLHWRTLLLTVAIGILIYSIRGGLGARSADGRADPKDSGASRSIVSYLLPKDIYTHVSARVDVWLWVLERVLRPIWAASVLLTVAPATERVVMTALTPKVHLPKREKGTIFQGCRPGSAQVPALVLSRFSRRR